MVGSIGQWGQSRDKILSFDQEDRNRYILTTAVTMFLFLSFLCFCFWLCNLVPALLCLCFCQTLSGVWVAGDLGNLGGTFGYKNTLMYSKETLTIALVWYQNKMQVKKWGDQSLLTRQGPAPCPCLALLHLLWQPCSHIRLLGTCGPVWLSGCMLPICAVHKLHCTCLKFLHLLLGDFANLLKCRRWGRWW